MFAPMPSAVPSRPFDLEALEFHVVRALLMYSTAFHVVFGCSYAFFRFPDEVRKALNLPDGRAFGGGSLWIERRG